MNLIPASLSRAVAKQALLAQKNAPQLLFAGGVIGSVGSTVLACRSTLRVSEILDEIQEDLQKSHDVQEHLQGLKNDPETAEKYKDTEYTDEQVKKDAVRIYIRGSLRIAKEYAPAVLLGAASIAMLSKSHNILQQRNAALTAAYVAIERSFNEYRDRVREKYGDDAERSIRFPREKIKEHNNETGREHTVEVVLDGDFSPYAKFFDETCSSFRKGPYGREENLIFLKNQQNLFNDLLHARGYVFLNEVYTSLGMDCTATGAVCGWILGGDGDNFVDFGLYREDGSTRDFIHGRESAVLLDFNVDGLMYDKLDQINKEVLAWPTAQ